MRRIVTFAILGFYLTACGGEPATDETPAEQSEQAESAPEPASSADATAAAQARADAEVAAVEAAALEAAAIVDATAPMAGWMGRTDGGEPLDDITVTPIEGGWRVDNGPAVVLWNAGLAAAGDYTLSATFRQLDSKGMVHGTGLVFGGNDLDGDGQVYTYFMVRGSGDYLLKNRRGAETFWIQPVEEWTHNAAVDTDEADGTNTNMLAVQFQGDEAIFRVNGTEVLRIPRGDLYSDGYVGVRLNHNLTIEVTDLRVIPG